MRGNYNELYARFFEATREFNVSMGQPDNVPINLELLYLRRNLITEEWGELSDELNKTIDQLLKNEGNIDRSTAEQIIKESCDLIYVVAGTAATFGLRYRPENAFAWYMGDDHPFYTKKSVEQVITIRQVFDNIENRYLELEMWVNCIKVQLTDDDCNEGLSRTEYEGITRCLEDITKMVIDFADYFGFPLLDAFNAVHASNMSKLGDDGKPVYREDGKVMKGPNYHKPDMSVFVEDDNDD